MSDREKVIDHLWESSNHGTERRDIEAAYDAGFAAGRLTDQPSAAPVDVSRFQKAPCYLCGYNGVGYFNSDIHPCAAAYHEADLARMRATDPTAAATD